MPTVVVWDCETDSSFGSLDGMTRDQKMRVMQATVTCAMVFDSEDCVVNENWDTAYAAASEHTFWRDVPAPDGGGPFTELFKLFDAAEVIVAFNGLSFDFPVFKKYYGTGRSASQRYMNHRMKTLDPMVRIAAATDLPFFKLDRLLEHNKLPTKTGNGLDAIKMWENGERDKLRDYCRMDVRALAQFVHLTTINVPNVGILPNAVHGIASAIRSARAVQPLPDAEAFELV